MLDYADIIWVSGAFRGNINSTFGKIEVSQQF